jgi:Zn-dependent peptidase ImmA (M78 family)/transcriptional regulator with XRE-family HTH domain
VPIDLVEFGKKLARCRTQLQLSIAEIGSSTGLPTERLEAFERGTETPSGDDILVLADFFTCDYRFFISNDQLAGFEQTDSLYRMHGSEFSKEDRRSVLEFIFLCESEQQLALEIRKPSVRFDFEPTGNYYKGHAEQAANALRKHFGYAQNAVPSDVYSDFRKLGFHVFRRRLQNSKISGITIRHPFAGTCILVNYDEDIYRQRFTAAHEAAHGILDQDRDVVVSFATASTREPLVEVRANTFAARYLLPPELVKAIPELTWSKEQALKWSNHFKVSTSALAISLKEAGLIDDDTARLLRSVSLPRELKIDPELAKLSPRMQKRKRELLERGLSTYYVDLCFQSLSHGVVSSGRVAEMMLVDDFELTEIAALFGLAIHTI